MKNLLLILFIFLGSTLYAQTTGWVPTGKIQLCPVTIIWDTLGAPEEKGYAELKELKYVPAADDKTKHIKRANAWVLSGKFYDAAKNPVEDVAGVYGINQITKQKFQF